MNRVKMIKSRRLKSKKYKRNTRIHSRKNKKGGGYRAHIDISPDEEYIYITDKSNMRYKLYKINLPNETFQEYEMKDYESYPLISSPRNLREILRENVEKNPILKEILERYEIDPNLLFHPPGLAAPAIVEVAPELAPAPLQPQEEQLVLEENVTVPPLPLQLSSKPSSSRSSRPSSSKALDRKKPLKITGKLQDAMNFAKTYKNSKSKQLPPLRSRPYISESMSGSPYLTNFTRKNK